MVMDKNSTCDSARSLWRHVFSSLLLLAAFIAIVATVVSSRQPAIAASGISNGPSQSGKISSWVTEHTANGQQAEFFVVLADQADLSAAANLQTKFEKGRFVYSTLSNK